MEKFDPQVEIPFLETNGNVDAKLGMAILLIGWSVAKSVTIVVATVNVNPNGSFTENAAIALSAISVDLATSPSLYGAIGLASLHVRKRLRKLL